MSGPWGVYLLLIVIYIVCVMMMACSQAPQQEVVLTCKSQDMIVLDRGRLWVQEPLLGSKLPLARGVDPRAYCAVRDGRRQFNH